MVIKRIKNYMKRNHLTQRELAKIIGCPETTLNRWLTRKNMVSHGYLCLLAGDGIIWKNYKRHLRKAQR